jgi:hypothetical protein
MHVFASNDGKHLLLEEKMLAQRSSAINMVVSKSEILPGDLFIRSIVSRLGRNATKAIFWPLTCTSKCRPGLVPTTRTWPLEATAAQPEVACEGDSVFQTKRSKERRKSSRLSLAVPVFARGCDERGKEFLEFTTALNISASGALIAMRRYLPPQSSIVVEVPAAPMPRLVTQPMPRRTLEAELVRITASEPSFLWALKFSHPLS